MQTSNYYDEQALNQPNRQVWQHRRREHNVVKNLLLTFALNRIRCNDIVDMACGKGGDLNKYAAQCPAAKITCVDASKNSLTVLQERNKKCRARVHALVHGDAASVSLPESGFDLVVVNFALHYFCDSGEHARNLLKNISEALRFGGMFIGTCIDYRTLSKGNKNITIDSKMLLGLAEDPWGRRYRYNLPKCVDADEYIVYFPKIVAQAHSLGLSLVKRQSFNGFLYANQCNPVTPDDNAPYMVFAFVKLAQDLPKTLQ